jgi:ABC-type lipoprotein export system ATPase subunit
MKNNGNMGPGTHRWLLPSCISQVMREFMNNPALFSDGPMGNLDEEIEMGMMPSFLNVKKAGDITSVLVTHKTDLTRQTKLSFRSQNSPIRTQ